METTTKAVGYVRVSTDEQAADGVSLAAQEAKIRMYAELYGLELVEVVVDAGESAKSLDRPGLRRVLDLLRQRKVEGVVVAKLDRLTRSVADLNGLIETFFSERAGRQLWSVADAIDTRTAAGRLVLNILASVSQWEREAIGERTRDAMRHMKARRQRVGAVPLGWRLADDGTTLVEDAAEQEVLRLVRELRQDGLSIREIVAELNARGVASKQGGRWHIATVQRALAA
jgi:DNA invertase Pin-like site-specific DNA recombinase